MCTKACSSTALALHNTNEMLDHENTCIHINVYKRLVARQSHCAAHRDWNCHGHVVGASAGYHAPVLSLLSPLCELEYLNFTNSVVQITRTLSSTCIRCISRASCTGIISIISRSWIVLSQHPKLYNLNSTNSIINLTSVFLLSPFHELYYLNVTNSVIIALAISVHQQGIMHPVLSLLSPIHELYHLNVTSSII